MTSMLDRFSGGEGERRKVEAFLAQKMVSGNQDLANALVQHSEFLDIPKDGLIIEQNDSTNDVFFIVSGSFSVIVNGRVVGIRGVGDHVGEMAAIEVTQKRSASIVAREPSVVARISESNFDELGNTFPQIYKHIARELSRRLFQRNRLVRDAHERSRVFIICSSEALPVARLINRAFAHDDFDVIVWSDGVFKVTNYTLDTLEKEVDKSDFAIAIAHADDISNFRGHPWPAPRDNVVFELGLFMGRLGRQRAILMEPREEKVKLPSDLAGVTTISYRYKAGDDELAVISPACDELRSYIQRVGPDKS